MEIKQVSLYVIKPLIAKITVDKLTSNAHIAGESTNPLVGSTPTSEGIETIL